METPETGFLIACAGFVTFFALLFGTLLMMRWFRHKERIAMIRQGLTPAEAVKPRNGKATLAWGIGISAFGLALLCGLSPFFLFDARAETGSVTGSIMPLLLPGLIILCMGIALVTIFFVTRPTAPQKPVEDIAPLEPDELPDLPALEPEEDEAAPEE